MSDSYNASYSGFGHYTSFDSFAPAELVYVESLMWFHQVAVADIRLLDEPNTKGSVNEGFNKFVCAMLRSVCVTLHKL